MIPNANAIDPIMIKTIFTAAKVCKKIEKGYSRR